MFNNILVPLDGSPLAECVLPHVLSVARSLKAKVTLLTVCVPRDGGEATRPVNSLRWSFRTVEADAYLDEVASRLRVAGLHVETQRVEGKAAEQILAFERQRGVDLMMLSTHGRSGLTGWNVGSVMQQIIARARVSVMIIRGHHLVTGDLGARIYSRLLCPLDCSPRAEHALPVATVLARSHSAQLILAHVLAKPNMPRHRPLTGEELEVSEKVIELNRAEAVRRLEYLQSSLEAAHVDAESRFLVGDEPAQSLHNLVREEKVDMVVMSAHGYSGSTSQSYGSLALNFIMYGTTSLLIAQDLSPDQIESAEGEMATKEPTGH